MIKSSSQRDESTEQRILDAAHLVFIRSGTAGARTQEIAKEAGGNSALLHYYFRSKERLAAAGFIPAPRQLLPPGIPILPSHPPPHPQVEPGVKTQVEHPLKRPYLPGY